MNKKAITILGIGSILFRDEGFGIRVVQLLEELYEFPENVTLVDGGVLGMNLLGIMSEADHLIVIDAIRNRGRPGTVYRLEGDEIPSRIRAKNSLHQIDFLETLTLCQALDRVPETVILGVEPEDIETLDVNLTPTLQARVEQVTEMVLQELTRLGIPYSRRSP